MRGRLPYTEWAVFPIASYHVVSTRILACRELPPYPTRTRDVSSYQIRSVLASRVLFLYPDGSALSPPGGYENLVSIVSDTSGTYITYVQAAV